MTVDKTLSAVVPRKGHAGRAAYLYLGLRCDAPLEQGHRFALTGLDAVAIGRGEQLSWTRVREAELVVLELRVPDPRMSSKHARLTRVGPSWVLEDRGSKNGVFVHGAPATRSALADDDVIDLGETLFVFGLDDEAEGDGEVSDAALGLATLIPSIAADYARLVRAAATTVPLCVSGETGTGKELVARAIHRASGRAGKLVAINCGALPPTLVEAELFGHRKGAFSGAGDDRLGLVRSADGGTLFLDEIAELPLSAQAALLRVLQEQEVTPIGADRPVPVDLRVVSATHHDLDLLVVAGKFREDLLGRLSGVSVELPPLRERRADLSILIGALLARLGAPPALRFSLAAGRALYRHPWRRNVRELERALAGALAVRTGDEIDLEQLPFEPEAVPLPAATELSDEDRAVRDHLADALARHGGNLAAVARELGKDRTQIRRWMRRFELHR